MRGAEFLLIAFRGTEDVRNWLTDLDCLQTGYPAADYGASRVHAGFWRAWQSVRRRLWEWFSTSMPDGSSSKVFLTGHSLGGALAMLAARELWRERQLLPVTYTFGQPRVGNAAFAQGFDLALRALTFRVVYADDIVPRVPWLLGSYRHAGQEVFYLSAGCCCRNSENGAAEHRRPTGQYLVNPSIVDKLLYDARNAVRELRRGKVALLDDHHIDNYLTLFQ
jgi:hypothetical protein